MTETKLDILAAIDAATGCQFCGGPLGDSPSDDFCDQQCAANWHSANTTTLVGYSEPWRDGSLPGVGASAMRWTAPRSWGLPRQTGDLMADIRACNRARDAATTPEQHAAVLVRAEQLAERAHPMFAEFGRAIGKALQSVADGFAEFGRQLGRALVSVRQVERQAPPQPVGTVAERALQARQNRNTGPPAARMDGRRGRGVRR